jgi:glycerol-3-phosphate dehydrogenase
LFGRHWNHRYYPPHEFIMLAPRIKFTDLKGGAQSSDAVTDDARLVFRVIQESLMEGALALNYVVAEKLITRKGRICGAVARDALSGETSEIHAKAVINATGAWTDRLRRQVGGEKCIRPLRGSHLVFPFWRLPIAQAIGLKHPADRRSVFLMPWEGVTVVGTTDLDHTEGLDTEACITPEEVDYLLEIVQDQFPGLDIGRSDILTTWSGVRPVIGTGALNPSKERRNHRIWIEQGLVSVSGGKLTTFRLIALDALRHATPFIPTLTAEDKGAPTVRNIKSQALSLHGLDPALRQRLIGRYGTTASDVLKCAKDGELSRVSGTDTFWAELRWAARAEFVVHLEDLLLRRTRIGVLLGDGGVSLFDRIRVICQEELGWDDARWNHEADAYKNLWRRHHSVPETSR